MFRQKKPSNLEDLFNLETLYPQFYILKGDNKTEPEIKPEYLKTLSSRKKEIRKKSTQFNYSTCITTTQLHTEPSSNSKTYNLNTAKKPTNLDEMNGIKEEMSNSDSDDEKSNYVKVQHGGGYMNYSFKSEEFLLTLYELGKCHNSISMENNDVVLTKRQKEQFKLDENNPYLYSFSKLHPFSIFYQTKYPELIKKNNQLKLPAPRFIKNDEWRKIIDFSFKNIFNGITIDDKLGLVISDPIIKGRFAGLIKNIIFQILKVPFGHHISLNVKIFEPKTIQERYMYLFCYANEYLVKAADENLTPYERFKFVITWLAAGMQCGCQQLKPFNPFLGETYQGEFPNGVKVYVENVTHKPLALRFYIKNKDIYMINGYFDVGVRSAVFGNEMYICEKGPVHVVFPKLKQEIVGHIPEIRVVNATSENGRALRYCGNHVFVDSKNNLKCVILYDFNEKCVHETKGYTMRYNFPANYKYNYDKEYEFGNKFKVNNFSSNFDIIDTIHGSFTRNLVIGNEEMWNIHEKIPDYIRPCKNVLPSDGRYREDLIWLYRALNNAKNKDEEKNYMEISQEWKVMMEEFNRWERKHRADYRAKTKKKKKK